MTTSTTSDTSDIRPFQWSVTEAEVADLQERLARTRWPDQLKDSGWDLGCDLSTLKALCADWQEFDVIGFVERMNAVPQFTTMIDGQNLHFWHIRSSREHALPLVITHGWPGSVWEFHRIVSSLTEPDDPIQPAYHVVCPSIPGYGFSGPTTELGWDTGRVAEAIAELMHRLGYGKYGAQGGDWGAIISAHIGSFDPTHCVGVHLNMVAAGPADPSNPLDGVLPEEVPDVVRAGAFRDDGTGYQAIQRTRPQTLSYGLTDSPAGLAGWILEKFHAWGDLHPTNGDVLARFGTDTLCSNLSIYWFTKTINASTRLYFESMNPSRAKPRPKVGVPTACALFPGDIYLAPRAWADHQYPNIVRWTRFPRGGHFAALEEPELLVGDIRAFFTPTLFGT